MPIYKPRLTRSEQAKYLRVEQELLASGVELNIPDEWSDNARALRIYDWRAAGKLDLPARERARGLCGLCDHIGRTRWGDFAGFPDHARMGSCCL